MHVPPSARPNSAAHADRSKRTSWRLLLVCAGTLAILVSSAVLVQDRTLGPGDLRTAAPGVEASTSATPTQQGPRRGGVSVDMTPRRPVPAAERRPTAPEQPRPRAQPQPRPRAQEQTRPTAQEQTRPTAQGQRRRQDRLRRQAAAAEEAAAALIPTSFRVASFNVLGSSHTAGPSGRAGFAAGASRMASAVDYLRAHAVDVVGFQELEDPQYATLVGAASEYAVWPGRALGPKSIRFSIAWNTNRWTLAEARSIGVPYAGGNYIQMPLVRLRHNVSGREVWFANFHNPADTPRLGANGRWRTIATAIEIGLASRLRAETGLPVIITGDMNDRAGYFCPMTTRTDLAAANGGSTGDVCSPPPAMQVDWIFGSADLVFSDYVADRAAPVPRLTDHPVVRADVYFAPAAE